MRRIFTNMIETRRYKMTADDLNRYGEEGWELVAVVVVAEHDGGYSTYYFKREAWVPK